MYFHTFLHTYLVYTVSIYFLIVLTVGLTWANVSEDEELCTVCVDVIDGYLLPGLGAKVDLTLTPQGGELIYTYTVNQRVALCML